MTTGISEAVDRIECAKALVLDALKIATEPTSMRTLIQQGLRNEPRISSSAMRQAVWVLYREGRIRFTDDWKLLAA